MEKEKPKLNNLDFILSFPRLTLFLDSFNINFSPLISSFHFSS